MLPPFDLQGGATLALARAATVMGLLSAFGTLLFRTLVAPKAFAWMAPDSVVVARRRLLALAQGSVAAALLGMCLWLVVQAADMADAGSVGAAFAALPAVLGRTSFGHTILWQFAALALLAAAIGRRDDDRRPWAALGAAGVATALQAGHSHAFSMVQGPSVLLGADIVHLLAAGGWLGGLLPLALLVRTAPPEAAAAAARWFSPVGQWCIAGLVASAGAQGWLLVASIPGLIGTAYGWMVLVKLVLFAALLGFAWFNRYRFAPALLRGVPDRARRVLLRSIALQTGVAVAIVAAAAVLSELPPAMHLQALWPFGERLSLDAVREDADFRREVLEAGLAIAASLAVLAGTLAMRRGRIPAAAAVLVVGWLAVPHLDLLLVTAYPTSFFQSPTDFASASIVDGGGLYARNCVTCHGAGGHGDGALAQRLAVPPADLTAAHLWMHSDGELFWWISEGMATPEGAKVMPGFAGALGDDARWALIDFIRARNAGAAKLRTGAWPVALRAPGFGLRCAGRALRLADLQGRFVRLVIGPAAPLADARDVVTVVAQSSAAAGGGCVTQDETVRAAYGILVGSAAGAPPGTEFLIDGGGWLRAMQPGGWGDPAALGAAVASLRGHAVVKPAAAMPMNMPM